MNPLFDEIMKTRRNDNLKTLIIITVTIGIIALTVYEYIR